MALTKVTGQVINTSTDVTVGVLTVTNTLAVGGTVSIGGTLTYEDVTNIDSVGLITARNGIVVGSGITLSKDGDVFFTGIATGNGSGLTALNASNIGSGTVPTARLGSGTASSSTFLRGDSTFQTVNTDLVSDTSPQLGGDLDTNGNNINFGDSGSSSDDRLVLGSDSDFEIYHTGSGAYIQNKTGTLFIGSNFDDDDGGDIRIQPKYGENSIVAYDDGPVELYYDNSRVFETDSASVKIRDNIKAKFGTGDDLEIYYDGTDGFVNQKNNALKFQHNGTTKFFLGSGYLSFADDYKIGLGNSQDLEIYHNGTNAQIDNNTGNLEIRNKGTFSGTRNIFIRAKVDESSITCKSDGAVELYYDNNKSLETTGDGGVKAQGNYIVGTAGRGLQFNASDSGSSEILDDYEEGTWTARFYPNSSAFGSSSYNLDTATYTRVGNVVYWAFRIRIASYSGGGGNLEISGLPYTVNSGQPQTTCHLHASNWANNPPKNIVYNSGSTRMALYYEAGSLNSATPTNPVPLSSLQANAYLIGQGFYFI